MKGDLAARGVFGDLRLDLVDLFVALCLRGGEALGDCDGAFLLSMSQEPARSLGHGGKEDEEEDGGDGHDAEHPAPRGFLVGDLADHRVGGVGQEDTEDDVELDQADQATTHASGAISAV